MSMRSVELPPARLFTPESGASRQGRFTVGHRLSAKVGRLNPPLVVARHWPAVVAQLLCKIAVLLGFLNGNVSAQTNETQAAPGPRTSTAADKSKPNSFELVIKATIDGRDELRVTHAGFEWIHHDWDWPVKVLLNDQVWDPKQQPKLKNDRDRLLPPGIKFTHPELVHRQGRGKVSLRKESGEAFVIQFHDLEVGADDYEVVIRFRDLPWLLTGAPKLPQARASEVFPGDLRITATIDGNDELRIYRDRAEWHHQAQGWPTAVKINGADWSPQDKPRLDNSGKTEFLPNWTVLVGATHWVLRGRGKVIFSVRPDHLSLLFADPDTGGDVYDVVIHQGEVFPELTVAEEDERHIAQLAGAAEHVPHPSDSNLPTQRDFDEHRLQWRRSRLVLAYDQHGHRDPKWDAAARTYLELAAQQTDASPEAFVDKGTRRIIVPRSAGPLKAAPPGQSIPPAAADELLFVGDRLIDLGCDDPLVSFAHALDLWRSGQFSQAEPYALHAVLGFEKSAYPRHCTRLAPALLARLYTKLWSDKSDVAYALLQRAIDETAETIGEPLAAGEARALLAELRDDLSRDDSRGLLSDQEPALLRRLDSIEKADAWVEHLLLSGYLHRQGWQGRGAGFSDTVSDEGSQIFSNCLTQSRAHLIAAWRLHAEFPEAASELIMTDRAIGPLGEETPRFWFDQAAAAQIDLRPAHYSLLWALRPRWGGSHEEMLQFGLECLRTRRFDTIVPRLFQDAVLDISSEQGDLPELMAEINADEEIRNLMIDYGKEGPESGRTRRLTVNLLAFRALGWNDDARRMNQELNGNIDNVVLTARQIDLRMLRYDLDNPVHSLRSARVVEAPGLLFQSPVPITAFDVSSKGEQVAAGAMSREHLLTVWNAANGQPQTLKVKHDLPVAMVQFSPDCQWLGVLQHNAPPKQNATPRWSTINLWKLSNGEERTVFPLEKHVVSSFCWLPTGEHFAVGLAGRAAIWSVETRQMQATTQVLKEFARAVAISTPDELLAVGFSNGAIHLYRLPSAADLTAAKEPLNLEFVADLKKHIGAIDRLQFSADGKALASSSHTDRSVWLWDVAARTARHRVDGWYAAFSLDGQKLATTRGGPSTWRQAIVWDVNTGEARMRCPVPDAQALLGLSFTPDGKFLLAPASDGGIYTWNIDDRE